MRTPVLAGVVAALVLLPGCAAAAGAAPSASVPATSVASSSAPAASQTKLEACDELAATMEESAAVLNDSMTLLSSDPNKALTALTTFNTSLASAVAKVTNPEVKAQGEKAAAAMKELIDALDDLIKNPADTKPEIFTVALTTMSAELTAIGTICGG